MKGFKVMAKKAVVKSKAKKPVNVSKKPVNVDKNPATARKMSAKTKKKPVKTKKPGKEVAVIQEKKTHKLTAAAIQSILDLTVAGLSIEAIIEYVKEAFGITIEEGVVFYHRRKNADKLMIKAEEEVAAARAMCPDSMFLAGRMRTIDTLIKKEMKRRRPSLMGMASILGAANQAVHQAETLRLRYKEFEKKYPAGKANDFEMFARELERRSHFARNVTEKVAEMEKVAGGDFVTQPDTIEAVKVEIMKEPEPAVPAKEPGEDALTR